MSDCYKCVHRRSTPGDCHSRCVFSFEVAGIPQPTGARHGINEGWWIFPWSFDPIWMMGDCGGFTPRVDRNRQVEK